MTENGSGDDERRPLIAPPYVPVVVDPDTVQFRIGPWAGPSYTIRDDDADGKIAELVRMLDGDETLEGILAAFDPEDLVEVESILDRLTEEDVLVHVGGSESDVPPVGVVSPTASLTADDVDAVARANVLVVNVGPIGRFVVEDLVSLGAENVRVVEPARGDDPTPLDDVPPEAYSIAGPDADLDAEIADADCVVYATADPRPGLVSAVNEIAFDEGVPWISGRLRGLDGFVGPAVVPGRTACFDCFRSRLLANVDDPVAYRGYERAVGNRDHGRGPLPALSRIVAGYVSIDLLHLLVDGIGFTAGNVLHFDFFDLTVESNSVLKQPRCRVCGPAGGDALGEQRFLDLDRLVEDGQ